MDIRTENGTENGTMEDDLPGVEITPKRLDELIRWHGTDESALPPAHTLQNLSRDTVAALQELAHDRETIARLRAAMARAFWAAERRELNAILLEALGPPPEDPSAEPVRLLSSPSHPSGLWSNIAEGWTESSNPRS